MNVVVLIVVFPATARGHATAEVIQNGILHGLSEIGVEVRVDYGIEGGVEVTDPEKTLD